MPKGEIFNVIKVDYSKKEIIPYKKTDYDWFEYIPFGSDNLFPQALALFSRLSPNHRGVLLSKDKYFQGDGIFGVDPVSEKWLERVNAEGQSINAVQKRLWIDDNRFGNIWIELITDRNGSFLFINHLDSTKCRKSKDEKYVIIHPDWGTYTGMSDKLRITRALYPNWAEDKESPGILRSVYIKFEYEPEFVFYGVPGYISGKDSIQIDFKTNKWNLARLVNGFRPDSMVFVPVKDKEESDKVLKIIASHHTGEGNQGKALVLTKSRAMEGQKADDVNIVQLKTDDAGSWMDLHNQSLSDIVMAHAWYRSLCSIPDNTGFDTQRILNEFTIALPTIKEKQAEYCRLYEKFHLEVTGKVMQFEFRNTPPLHSYKYLKIWEAREKMGLDFDKSDTTQQEIIKE